MLRAPFRTSHLPLGLYFPLEMKLPPGAMWIGECILEQQITSKIQLEYLAHYGRLARLPVPLFVYELTPEQVQGYEVLAQTRMSATAFERVQGKIADGLGVEVYYYPSLPVRAADLFVSSVKSAFKSALSAAALEATFNGWIRLLAEMLPLGYMPYAPWNHGMGACVDPGNACIDGGFNDLLTVVPFDSIPTEQLFWRSLVSSTQMLASSIVVMCAAATDTRPSSPSDPPAVAVAYVTERLRPHIRPERCIGHEIDPRLRRFCEMPSIEDVFRYLRETHREGNAAQFWQAPPSATGLTQQNPDGPGAGLEDSRVLGV
jgi:hypothetical protein